MSYFKNSKNYCTFIGRIGNELQIKDGTKSTKFSLATNRVYGKETKTEETIWIPCEIWNDHPVLPYLKKGDKVSVDTFYSTSTSGDGDDKKYFHTFRVDTVVLLEDKEDDLPY